MSNSKKLKKGLSILLAFVLILAVGGGIAFACSDTLKNKVKLATSEPYEYLTDVLNASVEKHKKEVKATYENMPKFFTKNGPSFNTVAALEYKPSTMVKTAISYGDFVPESLKAELRADFSGEALSFDLLAFLNDIELISAETVLDFEEDMYYLGLPSISDRYAVISHFNLNRVFFSDKLPEALNDLFLELTELSATYSDAEFATSLIDTYSPLIIKLLSEDCERTEVEFEAGGVTFTANSFSTTCTIGELTDFTEKLIKTAAGDEMLCEAIDAYTEFFSSELYDDDIMSAKDFLNEAAAEFKAEAASISKELKEYEALEIIIYVDNTGNICGMNFRINVDEDYDASENSVTFDTGYLSAKTDDEEGFTAWFDILYSIEQEDSSLYTSDKSFEIEYSGVREDGGLSGKGTLSYTEDDSDEPVAVEFEFTDAKYDSMKQTASGELVLLCDELFGAGTSATLVYDISPFSVSYELGGAFTGIDVGTLTYSCSFDDEPEINIPTETVDVMDHEELWQFLTELEDDLTIHLDSISEKLGVDINEIIDQLLDYF